MFISVSHHRLPEHGHGEPLGEHVNNEGPQGVQAGQLMGQVHPANFLPELEEENSCKDGLGGAMREKENYYLEL